ncbi:DUF6760 family protein [Kitasatospora sp. NPDC028055]|uniref:DUF6760 family protein n=1 Tax=unclassified Kitasatospora TaxID=2633591 RepID=UPI0034105BAD
MTYAPARLYEEIAYIAYHLHWSREDLLDLTHHERGQWVREVARLNSRISEGG